MDVKSLIQELQKMPQDAEVTHIWDGEPRTHIELVWLTKCGFVATSDYNELVYSDNNRPINAPTERDNKYWRTIQKPNRKDI